MTTYNKDWRLDWGNDLAYLMRQAEEAEQMLSYLSPCGSETARKKLGSYYTPADVSLFFWNEFLVLNTIKDPMQAKEFWKQHHFIEPAAGAGALILALLKKGGELGLSPYQLSLTELTIIDINQAALHFIKEQISWLESKWGIRFRHIRYICSDFRDYTIPASLRIPVFFGNPPFVSNPKGSAWRNLFADFLERAIWQSGPKGQCHFILPISIAFSRDYAPLREQMRKTGKSIALSSFDNIPDTLFTSGKPEHTNTNKANSQRCSILTVFPEEKPRILSTRMHSWTKKERKHILTTPPIYHDITGYALDNQFLRPANMSVLRYINGTEYAPRFHLLVSKNGRYSLYVSTVARNFIGFREDDSSGVHHLRFNSEEDFYSALLILSSDLFFDYWRTVGDGFHVTRTNIMNFPLHTQMLQSVRSKIAKGRRIWEKRMEYAKIKRHPGGQTLSYDFYHVALKITDEF